MLVVKVCGEWALSDSKRMSFCHSSASLSVPPTCYLRLALIYLQNIEERERERERERKEWTVSSNLGDNRESFHLSPKPQNVTYLSRDITLNVRVTCGTCSSEMNAYCVSEVCGVLISSD